MVDTGALAASIIAGWRADGKHIVALTAEVERLRSELMRMRQLYALRANTDGMTPDELAEWQSCMRKDDPFAD